ncbi:MAG: mechanosensitive ion channel family protein [Patescibacteria group bacterium]|nr:mechanosensitive ion channel family protein [Patescibacteria group bacterium]
MVENINFNQFMETLTPWLLNHGVRILLIIIGVFLINKFGKTIVDKIVRSMVKGDKYSSPQAEKKREDTIIKIFYGTFRVMVIIISLMMIMSEIGIDIGPIIAAVGVSGLAVGFGGQYLIRDIIAGLFILLENQYRVGDVIKINDIVGTVENITLRMTILRDLDGTVHNIPNGVIKVASNMSKDFSGINLDMEVAYNSNIEQVLETVNQVGKELAKDTDWKDKVTQAPYFARINDFGDSAIKIKILGQTKPLQQWDVTGELRKRLKAAFDEKGIEIPFPQQVIHWNKDE